MTYNHKEHSSEFRAQFKNGATDKAVIAALRDRELSCGALKEQFGGSFGAMEARLYRLEAAGEVERHRVQGRNYWRIPCALRPANSDPKGKKAEPRRYEWKPLGQYDIDAHRKLAMVTR